MIGKEGSGGKGKAWPNAASICASLRQHHVAEAQQLIPDPKSGGADAFIEQYQMFRLRLNIPAQAAAFKFDILILIISPFAEIARDHPVSFIVLPAWF